MDPRSTRMAEDGELCPTPKQPPHVPTRDDSRYALERTDSFIKVWFWSRGSASAPAEVVSGAGSINTDNWVRRIFSVGDINSRYHKKGTPDAYFPNTQCDIGAHFGSASIIINIDLYEQLHTTLVRSCP